MRSGRGFAQLSPAAASRQGARFLDLQNRPDAVWDFSDGMPPRRIGPLGVSFLSDVEVSGSGYFFSEGRFIREFAHTSDVALQWLADPAFPDNPLTTKRTRQVVIEDPVLLVFGPGSGIFGHWLVDFLPRLAIARQLLGGWFDSLPVLLPSDSPDWVARLLLAFCAIPPERIRWFDRMEEQVLCRRVCLPSFAHDGDHALHPMVRDFYSGFGAGAATPASRRICLTRRDQERHTRSYWRIFEARELFEAMALAHGFEIVQLEKMGFAEQVALVRSAACIIGEHGSGMHAAVFADPGTLVATIGATNAVQFHISAAFEHRMICMRRLDVLENAPGRPYRFTATEADLASLFKAIEAQPKHAA